MSVAEPNMPPSPERGRVLIVAGDRDDAQRLTSLLSEFDFVSEAVHSAEEALVQARAGAPDAVLMDTRLTGETDGIDGARLLQTELGLRVVYLTADFELSTLERAKSTLPYGFLLKPVRPWDLRCCIELAVHYRRLERAAGPSERPLSPGLRQLLSAREIEVLTLIARGHTSKDVANALRIAKPTVDTYRARLSEKLGLKNRTELMSFAAREGLLAVGRRKR